LLRQSRARIEATSEKITVDALWIAGWGASKPAGGR